MDFSFNIKNNGVSISFIPIAFNSLENLFSNMPIKKLENINIGLFIKNEEYIDNNNYLTYFPKVKYISDITDYFSTLTDEQYNIYKLDIIFENLSILYDDDSYLT